VIVKSKQDGVYFEDVIGKDSPFFLFGYFPQVEKFGVFSRDLARFIAQDGSVLATCDFATMPGNFKALEKTGVIFRVCTSLDEMLAGYTGKDVGTSLVTVKDIW